MTITILEVRELVAELGEESAEGDRIDGRDDDGRATEDCAGDGHALAAGLSPPRPSDGHDAEHERHDADQAAEEEEEGGDPDDAEHERSNRKALALLGPVARRRRSVPAGAAPVARGRRIPHGGGRAVPTGYRWPGPATRG